MPHSAKSKKSQSKSKRLNREKNGLPTDLTHRWAYLRRNRQVRRAYHQRYDKSGKQSCSFCGVGQVRKKEGCECAYCGAKVIKVAGEGWTPAPELKFTFKARHLKPRASAVTRRRLVWKK